MSGLVLLKRVLVKILDTRRRAGSQGQKVEPREMPRARPSSCSASPSTSWLLVLGRSNRASKSSYTQQTLNNNNNKDSLQ